VHKSFNRLNRISAEIKKEISFIIQKYINDPRIDRFSTIMDVIISKDFSHAKIFISYSEKNNSLKIFSLKALNNASGYMRFLLSKRLNLRIIPKITFLYDFSSINGQKISNLLRNLK
jgi:ribosome-binding factor A